MSSGKLAALLAAIMVATTVSSIGASAQTMPVFGVWDTNCSSHSEWKP